MWRLAMGWWGVSSCDSSFVGSWMVGWCGICPTKSRVVWWFKNFGEGSKEDITILQLDVEGRCVDEKSVKFRKPTTWCPLLDNDLIFNVDGSVRGNPGQAGIGGVLRDTSGKILCLFSTSIAGFMPLNAKNVSGSLLVALFSAFQELLVFVIKGVVHSLCVGSQGCID
ncbi:hypothetical protein Ddye_025260 [Dipteronia dyeriana]|uniref:RNase H type-1 domain-containing protein n=1 Tax=Dipteronia dyeriana TaxID=168575 RepID=A0AAD9TWW7_9ROSI|nr:hypothetical protein Ddye_025260 [Dipteronia dyeriana]